MWILTIYYIATFFVYSFIAKPQFLFSQLEKVFFKVS